MHPLMFVSAFIMTKQKSATPDRELSFPSCVNSSHESDKPYPLLIQPILWYSGYDHTTSIPSNTTRRIFISPPPIPHYDLQHTPQNPDTFWEIRSHGSGKSDTSERLKPQCGSLNFLPNFIPGLPQIKLLLLSRKHQAHPPRPRARDPLPAPPTHDRSLTCRARRYLFDDAESAKDARGSLFPGPKSQRRFLQYCNSRWAGEWSNGTAFSLSCHTAHERERDDWRWDLWQVAGRGGKLGGWTLGSSCTAGGETGAERKIPKGGWRG